MQYIYIIDGVRSLETSFNVPTFLRKTTSVNLRIDRSSNSLIIAKTPTDIDSFPFEGNPDLVFVSVDNQNARIKFNGGESEFYVTVESLLGDGEGFNFNVAVYRC
jgi:hypothetical protein